MTLRTDISGTTANVQAIPVTVAAVCPSSAIITAVDVRSGNGTTISATGSLTGSGTKTTVGNGATQSATGSLSSSGQKKTTGTASTITSVGSVSTATGTASRHGTAGTISATGSLSDTGTATRQGTGSISGTGTLTGSGVGGSQSHTAAATTLADRYSQRRRSTLLTQQGAGATITAHCSQPLACGAASTTGAGEALASALGGAGDGTSARAGAAKTHCRTRLLLARGSATRTGVAAISGRSQLGGRGTGPGRRRRDEDHLLLLTEGIT